MEFHHEIASTGELSDIGLLLRRNVDRSYRRGIELEYAWQAAPALRFRGNANLSHNRIHTWTQFYDVYDAAGNITGSEPITYHDVNPVLTPAMIVNQTIEYAPSSTLTLGVTGRHVGRSYLDNTNNPSLRRAGVHDRRCERRDRPLAQRARPRAGQQRAQQQARLSERLQLSLPHAGENHRGHLVLLPAGHAERGGDGGFQTLTFTPLEIAAVAFTLAGVILAIYENIWTWPTGIAGVLLYLVVNWRAHLYANAILQIVYFVLSIHGWYEWLHGGENKTELHVSRATPRTWATTMPVGVALTAPIWYLAPPGA